MNERDGRRILAFDRKGIKTDLFAIERYVDEVLDEILCKLQKEHFISKCLCIEDKNKFLFNINTPLSRYALEILNQLQNSKIGSYEHFEANYPAILPLDLYLKLEKRRKKKEKEKNEEVKKITKRQQKLIKLLNSNN